jgi:hypothetical protein
MHPFLAASLASNLTTDRLSAAEKAARGGAGGAGAAVHGGDGELVRRAGAVAGGDLVIRRAIAADAAALERLGALDGNRRGGELLGDLAQAHGVLVAELDGTIVAARALDGAVAVADPFRPSALHAQLLGLRARQIAGDEPAARRLAQRLVLHPRTP